MTETVCSGAATLAVGRVIRFSAPVLVALLLTLHLLGDDGATARDATPALMPIALEPQTCASPAPCNKITHIVFLVKENRTFDSMFGLLPGANGAHSYVTSRGAVKPLVHQPTSLASDIAHTLTAATTAIDDGKMDRFSQLHGAMQHGVDMADSQLYPTDIPNYWTYARTFTTADAFFSSVNSESFPNHLLTITARGANIIGNPTHGHVWGCDSPPTSTVTHLLPSGQSHQTVPCFDFPTLTDALDAKHIAWRYYAPQSGQRGYIWSSLDAIRHVRFSAEWTSNVVSYRRFASDARAGSLPAVSWLVTLPRSSDHPPYSICDGENWTVKQINAVMSNPATWAHTAIIVVWDDFGGFFDHVPPPTGPNPRAQYGLRVPALIISPYAKPAFVDHSFYTFSSLLKFADTIFGVPALPGIDQKAGDLMNAFDFDQEPHPPVTLAPRSCPPSP